MSALVLLRIQACCCGDAFAILYNCDVEKLPKKEARKIRDHNGNTLIHEAVKHGDTKKLAAFIKVGVPINHFNEDGFSALCLAIKLLDQDCVDILLAQDVKICSEAIDQAWRIKHASKQWTILLSLLKRIEEDRIFGFFEMGPTLRVVSFARFLYRRGVKASLCGSAPLIYMAASGYRQELVMLFLKMGHNPNLFFVTPAVSKHPLCVTNRSIMEILLESGADPLCIPPKMSYGANCSSAICTILGYGNRIELTKLLISYNTALNWHFYTHKRLLSRTTSYTPSYLNCPHGSPILSILSQNATEGLIHPRLYCPKETLAHINLLLQAGCLLDYLADQEKAKLIAFLDGVVDCKEKRWFRNYIKTPISLKNFCRFKIRSVFCGSQIKWAHKLPLPRDLVDFIMLRDIL